MQEFRPDKLRKWWVALPLNKQMDLLQIEVKTVVKQISNMKKLKSGCQCDICMSDESQNMSPELVSAIEHHLNSLILVKKNEKTNTYVTFLNVEKQKVSINREFLKDNGVHFFETMKKIHDVFPDDSSLAPHENPSPHNTHVNYNGNRYNLKNLFENVMKREETKDAITEQTCTRSGRLLFRVYLVRVLSHNVVGAYKEKLIQEKQNLLISSCAKDKKPKKKTQPKKQVLEDVLMDQEESIEEPQEEEEPNTPIEEEDPVPVVEKVEVGSKWKTIEKKRGPSRESTIKEDPWTGSNVYHGKLKDFDPIGFEISKRSQGYSPFTLPKIL